MHKKRRIFHTNPKDTSPIRTSFPTEFRSSENQFNAAKADEPKTSEYAFFKKLKTDASRKFNSHPLHKEEIRPNKFKARDLPVERSSEIKNISEDLRFPTEDGTHFNRQLLLTPVGVDLKRASTTFQDICSTGKSIEEGRTSRPEGTQNKHKDLFSRKRQKLYQSVADISFPDIGELCSKGYDFVSVLLSRLFPESNEETWQSFKIPNYWQLESVSNNKLVTTSSVPKKLPHSSIHLNKLPHYSPKNILEVECGSYLENSLSACWLDSLKERTHSNPDSPPYHSHSTILDSNLREPSCKSGDKISWIDSDSAFSFPLKNYGHLHSNHLSEVNDFHEPDDSLFRRKEHPLLLGWDSENVTDERTSLISQNTELIKYPMSLTSWSSDYEESLSDEFSPFGAGGLHELSVICKHTPNFYSLPPCHSPSYCGDEYRRHFLEDNEDIAANLSHYPLTLSLLSDVPSYPSLTEYCNQDHTRKGNWILPSPGNYHWFAKEVFNEQHYDPGMEVLLSSKPDYDLGRECLSISESSNNHYSFIHPALPSPQKEDIFSHSLANDEYENFMDGLNPRGILDHFIEDMVSVRDWSPFCCPISLDKQKPCSVLFDKSSCDEFEGKIYDEDRMT